MWQHATTLDVLHVIHQFPPETNGGSESYVLDLAQLQRRAGLDAQVLTGSMEWKPQVEVDRYEIHGIPVRRIHRDDSYFDHHVKAWHPGIASKFGEILDETKPKVIHVHQWVRLTNDLIATAHERSVPAVVQIHDFYTSCPRAFRARHDDPACMRKVSGASCWDCVPKYGHEPRTELEEGVDLFAASLRRELALAHSVLVAVPAIGDLLAEVSGMPRERYRNLTLGYRRRFEGMPKLPAPQPGERIRFAFWGGVGRHKGVTGLVQALRLLVQQGQLAQRGLPVELHVLGGFETEAFEQELRRLADGLPVTFHGRFTAAQLHAARPHVGVFPSTCLETFGFVLDECFELSLPCIVSDIGAFPHRVGGAGLVTKAGDPASLAAAMARHVHEPGLRERMVAAIPAPSPSMEEHCRQLAEVYREAQSTKAPAPCAPAVPLLRRLHFLMAQRDAALGQLIPKQGFR